MRHEPKLPEIENGASDVVSWVEAQAQWIRTQFGQRAVVRAQVEGGEWVELEQLYALRNDGIILVTRLDEREVHLSTHPSRVVLALRHAPEGEFCTGVGVIGASKTPIVLIRRTTEEPERPEHDH